MSRAPRERERAGRGRGGAREAAPGGPRVLPPTPHMFVPAARTRRRPWGARRRPGALASVSACPRSAFPSSARNLCEVILLWLANSFFFFFLANCFPFRGARLITQGFSEGPQLNGNELGNSLPASQVTCALKIKRSRGSLGITVFR